MLSFFLFLWIQSALAQDQWRLVYVDGSVESAWGLPRLDEEKREHLQYAWVWSEMRAPRRVEPKDIGKVHFPDDTGRLEVRIVRPRDAHRPIDARVIAAPLDMWRDLPESSLPSWPASTGGRIVIPRDSGQRIRSRLAGPMEGSWWVDASPGQAAVLLASGEAAGIHVQVTDALGKPLSAVNGAALEGTARQGRNRLWATLRTETGRLDLPGLPDLEDVALTVTKPGFAPATLRGRPSELPGRLQLDTGATLSGRTVDAAGKPVAGVALEVESWASPEVAQLFRVGGRSGKGGSWMIVGVLPGSVFLSARAAGFAPYGEKIDAAPGKTDLGSLTLTAGLPVSVLVVDEQREPVANARIEYGPGSSADTNPRGIAKLADVSPGAPLKLIANAERHLPGKAQFNPPIPGQVRIELPRAHTVLGRFLEAPGVPAAGGLVKTDQASCQKEGRLAEDGGFELALPPGEVVTVVLRSPRTRELRLVLPKGMAGSVSDLGDLLAPPSLTVTGRVVREEDDAPVAGARVWLPRPGPDGPLLAWAARDLVEASTREDGRFLLAGLGPGPALLRIDAGGFARSYLDFVPAEDGASDLGDIRLLEGATLRVRAGDAEGAVARADLRGGWIEPDMVTAPVRDGEAILRNIPPGQVLVSVMAGRKLLCERQVEVPADAAEAEVDCQRAALTVTGLVRIGGAPSGSGLLLWQPPAVSTASRIDNVVSPGGLRRQTIVGEGRPQVDVTVGPDGGFETADLTPGRWQVSWTAEAGMSSTSQEVEIPEGDHFETVISFPGLAVTGQVMDEQERPVEGARVRELTAGALALTGADGIFTLAGLDGPKAVLQASLGELSSPTVEIELSPGQPAEPVLLTLERSSSAQIAVRVVSAEGSPAAGAFVFLEEEGKGLRVLTASADGTASAAFEPPLPARVRAAAMLGSSWSLGSWLSLDQAREGLSLTLAGRDEGMLVESAACQGSPHVLSPEGWDLSWMLQLLGTPAFIAPGRPFRLEGLPSGTYTLSLDGASVTVPVHPGELVEEKLGSGACSRPG